MTIRTWPDARRIARIASTPPVLTTPSPITTICGRCLCNCASADAASWVIDTTQNSVKPSRSFRKPSSTSCSLSTSRTLIDDIEDPLGSAFTTVKDQNMGASSLLLLAPVG